METLKNNVNKIGKEIKKIKANTNPNKNGNRNRISKPNLRTGQNVVDYRQYPNGSKELMSALQQYRKLTRSQYLSGVIHPDQAVRNGTEVKYYNDVPIPTSGVNSHIQLQFTTSSVGTFLLSWRPCLFVQQGDALSLSNITFNNAAGLTGLVGVAGNSFINGVGYQFNVPIQKYRLTAAMCKVSYNGAVLSQAGTMLTCATFDRLSIGNAVAAVSDALVDRFGNFSTIANGLWNRTQNITKDSEGMEMLYVPMDYDDYVFQQSGYYFGSAYPAGGASVQPDTEGAHINYICAGRNLPVSSQCIIVDLYTCYEVIPDPTAVPILKPTVNMALDRSHSEQYKDSIREVANAGGLIRNSSSDTSSWETTLGKIFKFGINALPKILAALAG